MSEAFGYNEEMCGLFKSEVFPSDVFTKGNQANDNKVGKSVP